MLIMWWCCIPTLPSLPKARIKSQGKPITTRHGVINILRAKQDLISDNHSYIFISEKQNGPKGTQRMIKIISSSDKVKSDSKLYTSEEEPIKDWMGSAALILACLSDTNDVRQQPFSSRFSLRQPKQTQLVIRYGNFSDLTPPPIHYVISLLLTNDLNASTRNTLEALNVSKILCENSTQGYWFLMTLRNVHSWKLDVACNFKLTQDILWPPNCPSNLNFTVFKM